MERGQLVEVLDNSKTTWMVLTVARQQGELEMEGFLPSSCLRLATRGKWAELELQVGISDGHFSR